MFSHTKYAEARLRISISTSISSTRLWRRSSASSAFSLLVKPLDPAGVDVADGHPPAQARLAYAQILGDLADWLLTGAGELDSPSAELRRS
jgi:hypothetical protein